MIGKFIPDEQATKPGVILRIMVNAAGQEAASGLFDEDPETARRAMEPAWSRVVKHLPVIVADHGDVVVVSWWEYGTPGSAPRVEAQGRLPQWLLDDYRNPDLQPTDLIQHAIDHGTIPAPVPN